MKKIFTLIAMAIMTIAANAETTTVWTGSETAAWDKNISTGKNWSELKAGDVLTFTASDVTSSAVFHLLDQSWTEILKDITFNGSTATVTITDAVVEKAATANATVGVQGNGFTLTKVELTTADEPQPALEDLPTSKTLWTGEAEITGWGTKVLGLDGEWTVKFGELYTKAAPIYFLVEAEDGANFRIAGGWGDWAETEYPAKDTNHMTAKDADNVVRVELTQEFITNATTEQKGFFVWGNGFKVKAVGTTKQTLVDYATGISQLSPLSSQLNGSFNLAGQRVNANAKGLVIENGKKVLK